MRNDSAFTLVEVVVATALMIVSLTAFVSSFVVAKKSAVISENRVASVHNARNVMEQLMACDYEDARLDPGAYAVTSVTGVQYGVEEITNSLYEVKNIAVTAKWVNAASSVTSVFVLTCSMSLELHKQE